MKQKILGNWGFMRFFRLALGVVIIVQSLIAKNWMTAIAGVLFTCMPVFNLDCCGTSGCATPVKKNTEPAKDISYEEVI